MAGLVKPHGGGALKPLLLEGDEREKEIKRAGTLPKVAMTSRETSDLIMLGIGAFTPLEGFMSHADWQGVCDDYKTASGLFWPIPITLSTSKQIADTIKQGQEVALVDDDSGEIMGTMAVTEKYKIDKAHECMSV
ncbi:MAG TPA: sulfate adenylyltransferase, partial [Nitrospirae bacterium]|nr:sulfate adenylyltransferase [Nitrospirota bacterium]